MFWIVATLYLAAALITTRLVYIRSSKSNAPDIGLALLLGIAWPIVVLVCLANMTLFRETRYQRLRREQAEELAERKKALRALLDSAPDLLSDQDKADLKRWAREDSERARYWNFTTGYPR